MTVWRQLAPGETDHEVIWPIVSAGCLALAVAWLKFQLPIPRCGFHIATGVPCPACGATRCVIALLHGRWLEALGFNPAVFITLSLLAIFDVYAVAVLAFRAPRLRVPLPAFVRPTVLRVVLVAALSLNWAYLIHRGDI